VASAQLIDRVALGFVACGALIALASPHGFAQSEQDRAQKLRQRTFDVVWKTVNDKYFDPQFGGVDWAGVRLKYAPQVASSNTDAELVGLLSRMLSEIKISHLQILDLTTLAKQLGRAEVTRGVTFRDIGGQVVATRIVERSPAAKAGLQPGFVLTTIDGMPVANARNAEADLADDTDTHRLAVLDEADRTREVSLDYALPAAEALVSETILGAGRHVLFESRQLAGGIGYIHFTNFIEPLKKKLPPAFEAMRTASALVIDLRGNSGGDTEAGLALASMLVDKETQLAIERFRKGDDYYYKAKPRKGAYQGPVVVVIDENSRSESEMVTAGLQTAGRVVVVGKTSRGEVMDATFQPLPIESIALLYPMALPRTTKGVVIEGHGVIPDIDVSLTRQELLKNRDAQLEAAIAHLQKSGPRAGR
jgi:carboxyl-terminal processing protease